MIHSRIAYLADLQLDPKISTLRYSSLPFDNIPSILSRFSLKLEIDPPKESSTKPPELKISQTSKNDGIFLGLDANSFRRINGPNGGSDNKRNSQSYRYVLEVEQEQAKLPSGIRADHQLIVDSTENIVLLAQGGNLIF